MESAVDASTGPSRVQDEWTQCSARDSRSGGGDLVRAGALVRRARAVDGGDRVAVRGARAHVAVDEGRRAGEGRPHADEPAGARRPVHGVQRDVGVGARRPRETERTGRRDDDEVGRRTRVGWCRQGTPRRDPRAVRRRTPADPRAPHEPRSGTRRRCRAPCPRRSWPGRPRSPSRARPRSPRLSARRRQGSPRRCAVDELGRRIPAKGDPAVSGSGAEGARWPGCGEIRDGEPLRGCTDSSLRVRGGHDVDVAPTRSQPAAVDPLHRSAPHDGRRGRVEAHGGDLVVTDDATRGRASPA